MGFRRRGTKALLASSLVIQIAGLVRYVLLARLLGPEQLGLAATLILTQAFFDSATDMAVDRFLIQDKDGDDVSVQDFVQFVLVSRGMAIAIGLVVCAWPLAYFYNAPRLAPALAALAIYPLVASFIHLDVKRAQRGNDFRPEAIASAVSESAGLATTILVAYITRSYVAVLYGLIARSLALVITSHFLGQRRYGLKFHKEHAIRVARFSTPLMLTGMILFFAGQGDRVLVARNMGFAGLGYYSTVMLLILYPSSTLHTFMHTMYMPLIAGAREDHARRASISAKLGGETVLLSLCMAAGFAVVAPLVIPILYGHRFQQPIFMVAMIGILQCARYLTVWPTTVGIGMGRSSIILVSNVVRLIAWPAAIVGVHMGLGLAGIVLGFIFGEMVAAGWALIMLNRSENVNLMRGFDRLAVFAAGSALIMAWIVFSASFSVGHFLGLSAATAALIAWIAFSEGRTIREAFSLAKRIAGIPI